MLTRLLLTHALVVTILFVNRTPSVAQSPEAAKPANVSAPTHGQDKREDKDKDKDKESKRAEDPAVQDSFIIRQLATKIAFENDGTEARETSAQIQVLSDAGVQRWGVVSFSYQNINETLDIDYVRVKKANGSIVLSPPENIQDITSEISRVAPLYTDERQKHVAVKGLSPGDVLEYSVRSQIAKPPIPGQFWAEYSFERDASVMNETLEISVPAAREIKFKNCGPGYVLSTEGDRRTYRWTHSNPNPKNKDDEASATWKLARGRKDPPDVLLSSFKSWDELGRWYESLQQERVKPSPEIAAKAAELTKGAPDEKAKIKSIYAFVSTRFRYIGIDLGIGRYQPHFAADVLENGYGDCKDKHTLLASLLAAAGFTAYPALISTHRELDPDVPSPGQFNHVISVVVQGNERIWLDTTPEVAPFEFLLASLRGKHSLVIPPARPATLQVTPENPDLKSSQTFDMKASLDDQGTLSGDAERTIGQSDFEVLLRSNFRSLAMPQWKDLVQRLSYGSGFGGDVSQVSVTPPEDLSRPFRISYKYNRKNYSDWDDHRIGPPLPFIYLPEVKDDDKTPTTPLWLGVPGEVIFRSSVVLPKGYSLEVPKNVDLKEDFAEYHATYSLNESTFTAERHLTFSVSELPVSTYERYKAFRKQVNDDHDLLATLTPISPAKQETASSPAASLQGAMNQMGQSIWALPASEDSVAAQYESDARTSIMRNDIDSAIGSLRSAVNKDPRFARAWLLLGSMLGARFQSDEAIEAFHNAISADPGRAISYKLLGFGLMSARQYENAVGTWQSLIKLAPNDEDAHANLGLAFLSLKRYGDAASALESAIKILPDKVTLHLSLASSYLNAGDATKAHAAFERAIKLDSSPMVLNEVAYELAEKNLDLDSARDYSEKAVRTEEKAAGNTTISDIKGSDINHAQTLAAYWDTLGWVYFRLNDLPGAERYIKAAWRISQSPVIGDHLGRIYEKQGKRLAAVHVYQLAHSAGPLRVAIRPASLISDPGNDIDNDLKRLGGKPDTGKAVTELNQMRTFQLPRIVKGTASADFFVLLGPGNKVEAKFISGAESLKSAETAVARVNYSFAFPDDGPTRIVHKSMLGCYPYSGCSIVFMIPPTTFSGPPLVP